MTTISTGIPTYRVSRLAKSTLPLLKQALAEGRTLYEGFADDYMRAADRELGADVRRPAYLLIGTAILGADNHKEAMKAYMTNLPPNSSTNSEYDAQLFSEFNVVRLLSYDELAPFDDRLPGLESLTQNRAFVLGDPRTIQASRVRAAGRDEAALVEAVEAFAALSDATAAGVLISVEWFPSPLDSTAGRRSARIGGTHC